MPILLDKILVVDIECTCWDGVVPAGMISEIIEIGVCLLDVKTGEISDNIGMLIKPTRSTVSPFCTKLTTITTDMLEKDGISFDEACSILESEYFSRQYQWASFGAYDLNMFKTQCSLFAIRFPFSPNHLNVKTLFASKNKLPRKVEVLEALEYLNIKPEGTYHRGVDDAKNIAKILRSIIT